MALSVKTVSLLLQLAKSSCNPGSSVAAKGSELKHCHTQFYQVNCAVRPKSQSMGFCLLQDKDERYETELKHSTRLYCLHWHPSKPAELVTSSDDKYIR